jgi:hypothetical protein
MQSLQKDVFVTRTELVNRFTYRCLLPILAVCIAPAVGRAQFINPGFESGIGGWTFIGDARAVAADYGVTPAGGALQGLVDTDPATGHPASAVVGTLESFLGINAGSLTALGNGNALQGSAMYQEIDNVLPGQTLNFSYNFGTTETHTTPQRANDFAYLMVRPVGGAGNTATLSTLASVSSFYSGTILPVTFGSEASGPFGMSRGQTGYQGFSSYTFASGGNYIVAFGVVDVGPNAIDYAFGNSTLLVDNVTLTVVPEPQAWSWAAGFGLCAVAGFRRWGKAINFRTRQ